MKLPWYPVVEPVTTIDWPLFEPIKNSFVLNWIFVNFEGKYWANGRYSERADAVATRSDMPGRYPHFWKPPSLVQRQLPRTFTPSPRHLKSTPLIPTPLQQMSRGFNATGSGNFAQCFLSATETSSLSFVIYGLCKIEIPVSGHCQLLLSSQRYRRVSQNEEESFTVLVK